MLHAKMLDWVYSLTETGLSCDVGVGNVGRIERLAFACYRRGFEDGKKKVESESKAKAKEKRKVRPRRTNSLNCRHG